MFTLDSLRNQLLTLRPHLEQDWHVRRLGVFGSYASGKATPESDLDMLVEFSQVPGWDFFDLEDELSTRLGIKVDLTTPGGLHPRLADTILASTQYVF